MTDAQEAGAREQPTLRRSARKARDRSIALVLIGAILLLPPIAGISLIDGRVAGLPIPLLYLFSVWLALIVGAWRLSHAMNERDDDTQDAEGRESPS